MNDIDRTWTDKGPLELQNDTDSAIMYALAKTDDVHPTINVAKRSIFDDMHKLTMHTFISEKGPRDADNQS